MFGNVRQPTLEKRGKRAINYVIRINLQRAYI